jgi:hypothetical protein
MTALTKHPTVYATRGRKTLIRYLTELHLFYNYDSSALSPEPYVFSSLIEKRQNTYTKLHSFVWYLTLREEHRPRVFEDRVLRSIFRLKKDEMIRGWRKLQN